MDCPHCGRTIVADSSNINRLLELHIQQYHDQGYRRLDSWHTCPSCMGTGKVGIGIKCSTCNGSGKV